MVLVDTSIWIDYFRGIETSLLLNELIDNNDICINDLILAELIPSIAHRDEHELKDMLYSITKLPIDINWHNIIQMQIKNIKNGINNVGIPDLLIVQNVIENEVKILSSDKHFALMSKIHSFEMYG